MIVTATELKSHLGKYLDAATTQDLIITKNGKTIARLTSPASHKLAMLDELAGVAAHAGNVNEDAIRQERLARQ